MIRTKVWILLVVFAIGVVSCDGTPPTTPEATSSPPSQVWILEPQDRDSLRFGEPYLIKFQGASFYGIDQFEVKIPNVQEWSIEPLTSGSGGPAYGTMFYGEVTWTPHAKGNFTISVRAMNATGSSPWSTVHVTVVGIPIEPKATILPEARSTLTPTKALWRGLAKMNANCRTGPGTVYNETGFVPKGYTAEVVGRNEDGTWVNLINPNGKGICWASIIAFEIQFDMDTLPVALAPTPPSPSGQGESEEEKPKGCMVPNPLNNQIRCVSPCPAGIVPGKACTP
jgi:hypothetical protein